MIAMDADGRFIFGCDIAYVSDVDAAMKHCPKRMSLCTHNNMQAFLFSYMYIYIYVCIRNHTCVYISMYEFVHIHTDMCMHGRGAGGAVHA